MLQNMMDGTMDNSSNDENARLQRSATPIACSDAELSLQVQHFVNGLSSNPSHSGASGSSDENPICPAIISFHDTLMMELRTNRFTSVAQPPVWSRSEVSALLEGSNLVHDLEHNALLIDENGSTGDLVGTLTSKSPPPLTAGRFSLQSE